MSEDLIKIAAEYDAAGRIMARGFVDEFDKLAHNLGTPKLAMMGGMGGGGMGGPMYGGGLGNLGGKKAPKFTDKVNPTDAPGAFGTGTGDDVHKDDRKGVSEGAPGKRPDAPKGAGDGKGPGSPSTHLFMQD